MAAILSDRSKRITVDIQWSRRNDVGPWMSFQVPVYSDGGWPLFIKGGYSSIVDKIQFSLIHQVYGRIYGLCIGGSHKNSDGTRVESPHKHRWTASDPSWAYVPEDITATDPAEAWQQFCAEAGIVHKGRLEHHHSIIQVELL